MVNGDRIVRITSLLGMILQGIIGFPVIFAYDGEHIAHDYMMFLAWIICVIVLCSIRFQTEAQIRLFYFIEIFSLTAFSFYFSAIIERPLAFIFYAFIIWLLNFAGLRKYLFVVLTILDVLVIGLMTFFINGIDYVDFLISVAVFAAACWISFIFANRMEKLVQTIDEQKQSYDDMITLVEGRFLEEKGANTQKSAFLANMSHEIRTPINAILGLNTMTMRECKDKNILEYAGEIESAGQTLLALINDILDISKVESGKMDITPVKYELSTLINDVVLMINFKARAKKLDVKVNVNPELPNGLIGDDVRVRQILINLMNNAVKYTEKGSITLSVDGEAAENEVMLKFSISDTGIGIREEDMDKLFAKFERLDIEKNRNVEGTGLGMSITTKLLELMHSKLSVSSVYGEGSTFSFRLVQGIDNAEKVGDVSSKADYTKEPSAKVERFIAPDARILVVDDNMVNRTVFKHLLKRTKVMVEEADSGQASLELLFVNEYDIVFLDHMMPGMDGVETLKRMRENSICPNINTPMIALTANAIQGSREFYLESGFDDYMSKPIDPEKLEKMIFELLPEEKIERV